MCKGNKIISYLYAKAISKKWETGSFVNHITLQIALNRFFANKLIRSGIPHENIGICGNFFINFADKVTKKRNHFFFFLAASAPKRDCSVF